MIRSYKRIRDAIEASFARGISSTPSLTPSLMNAHLNRHKNYNSASLLRIDALNRQESSDFKDDESYDDVCQNSDVFDDDSDNDDDIETQYRKLFWCLTEASFACRKLHHDDRNEPKWMRGKYVLGEPIIDSALEISKLVKHETDKDFCRSNDATSEEIDVDSKKLAGRRRAESKRLKKKNTFHLRNG